MYNKTFRPFVFLFVIVALVSLACGIDWGTSTTEPPVQQPQQPQQPSQPQATEEPVQPSAQAEQFFTEEFDQSVDNWSYFLTHGDENAMNLIVEGGYLTFDLPAEGLWVYTLYDPYTYEDVRIDVRAENRGDNKNNISLICRYDEKDGWYEFNIENTGLYNILYGKWNDDMRGASYAKIADGGSNAIRSGKDVNEYTAICKGRTLILYINGKQVRSVDDNQRVLRSGQIGIGVSSFDRFPVIVDYDWVKVSQP